MQNKTQEIKMVQRNADMYIYSLLCFPVYSVRILTTVIVITAWIALAKDTTSNTVLATRTSDSGTLRTIRSWGVDHQAGASHLFGVAAYHPCDWIQNQTTEDRLLHPWGNSAVCVLHRLLVRYANTFHEKLVEAVESLCFCCDDIAKHEGNPSFYMTFPASVPLRDILRLWTP